MSDPLNPNPQDAPPWDTTASNPNPAPQPPQSAPVASNPGDVQPLNNPYGMAPGAPVPAILPPPPAPVPATPQVAVQPTPAYAQPPQLPPPPPVPQVQQPGFQPPGPSQSLQPAVPQMATPPMTAAVGGFFPALGGQSQIAPSAQAAAQALAQSPMGRYFPSQEQVAPPLPPQPGMVFPLASLMFNVKDQNLRTINLYLADDAADDNKFLCVQPPWRGPMTMMAPVAGFIRHVSWQNGSKMVDNPGSCQPCAFDAQHAQANQYPGMPQMQRDTRDRCENWVELVLARIEGHPQQPQSWQLAGLYCLPCSKTAFEEAYNFYWYRVLGARQEGLVPWAYTYMLAIKHIKARNEWNIPRFVRNQDELMTGKWHREGFRSDRTPEIPDYQSFATPAHIVDAINAKVLGQTLEAYALALYQYKQEDAARLIRDQMKTRAVAALPVVGQAAVPQQNWQQPVQAGLPAPVPSMPVPQVVSPTGPPLPLPGVPVVGGAAQAAPPQQTVQDYLSQMTGGVK